MSCLTERSRCGGPRLSVEVLLGDDVRRRHRPGLRDLDVLLLEEHLALLVRDRRGAQLPLEGVEGVRDPVREEPPEGEAPERAAGRFLSSLAGRPFFRPRLRVCASGLSSVRGVHVRESLPFPSSSVPPEDETTPLPAAWSVFRALSALSRVPRVWRMGLSHKVIPASSFFKGKNATASVFLSVAHKIVGLMPSSGNAGDTRSV